MELGILPLITPLVAQPDAYAFIQEGELAPQSLFPECRKSKRILGKIVPSGRNRMVVPVDSAGPSA